MAENKKESILEHPQKMYHSEEFEMQKQEAPGIHDKMKPVPDCGEESYKGCGKLTGRKALITGGDSGIGRAAAIAFAREGAQVTINYMPEEQSDADSLAELFDKENLTLHMIPQDVRSEEACKKIVEEAVEAMGGLDILVLNAAVQQANDDITSLASEQIQKTFEVNVFAPMYMAKAAIPHLKPGSSIIISGSAEYYTPNKVLLDYAASKFAVVGFSRALAKQIIDKGIRVNTVCPGPVWTPLEISGGNLDEMIPEHGLDTPLKRAGQPVELAGVYVYLASNDASYVTGEVYGVTGGLSAG